MLGRSAIQIAVDNENTELVELLLMQDGVKIGDALLYAIREGVYKIVEVTTTVTSRLWLVGQEWDIVGVGHRTHPKQFSLTITAMFVAEMTK